MVGGLFLGELPFPNHALDQRVVLGQLLQGTVAKPIGAGVSDVHHVGLSVRGQKRGDRGAHPAQVLVGLASLQDAVVRFLDLFDEVLQVFLHGRCRGGIDRLKGQRGRHVPALVTAHPVGHREQRLLHQVGVFVANPSPPDVASGSDADLHRRSSSVVLPILTRSPALSSAGEVTRFWFR